MHHARSDNHAAASVAHSKTQQNCFTCVILGRPVCIAFPITAGQRIYAGGGVVLEDDVCIIWIDFYSAHFTAYQPDSSGNEQFCEDLPDTGETIFVLDYLHQSLKEVPVDFRIIRDVTGLGRYARLEQVQEAGGYRTAHRVLPAAGHSPGCFFQN